MGETTGMLPERKEGSGHLGTGLCEEGKDVPLLCKLVMQSVFLQNPRWLPLCCSSWKKKMPSG